VQAEAAVATERLAVGVTATQAGRKSCQLRAVVVSKKEPQLQRYGLRFFDTSVLVDSEEPSTCCFCSGDKASRALQISAIFNADPTRSKWSCGTREQQALTPSLRHTFDYLPDVFSDTNVSPKTFHTWLEWTENNWPLLQDSQNAVPLLFFSFSLLSLKVKPHIGTHRTKPSGSTSPYISTFLFPGLHMPLISTYCCIIYLS